MVSLLDFILTIFGFCLMFRVMLFWLPELRRYSVSRILENLTDPYLRFFRSKIPPLGGVVDISPMIALFTIQGLQALLRYFFA
jgi:uncharacterized protein YggT (Ycf19 family)